MARKKKRFIDKKNSSTYHLIHRSQRDVDNDTGSEYILWPAPTNSAETDAKVLQPERKNQLEEWSDQLKHSGLLDKDAFSKHTKVITGTGDLLDATGKLVKETVTSVGLRVEEEEDPLIQEVERQLESIALTPECMDDDIAEALFGDNVDYGDYEDLNDEFFVDAAQEPKEEADVPDGGFDFNAHVQALIDKAKLEREGPMGILHEHGQQDQDFFARGKVLGREDDDDSNYHYDETDWQIDESTPGVVSQLGPEEEQALCEKFEETLLEYDSDEIGEGLDESYDEEDPAHDSHFEAALDDFLLEKQGDIYIRQEKRNTQATGGSGFSALVGTEMIPLKNLPDDAPVHGEIRRLEDVLGEASMTLQEGKAAPPPEEILIDGKSYFSEKMRNPWDCESILTTYSNLDNNPVTISGGGRRRRQKKNKKKTNQGQNDSVQQIALSDKTGLPLGVLSEGNLDEVDRYYDDDTQNYTQMSINKGIARSKQETAEEKKLRKLQVKKERQLARMQKKMMKQAFGEELSKRGQMVLADDVGGQSVFRF